MLSGCRVHYVVLTTTLFYLLTNDYSLVVCLSTSLSMLRNIPFFFFIKRDIKKRLNTVQNLFTYEISNETVFSYFPVIIYSNICPKLLSTALLGSLISVISAGFTNISYLSHKIYFQTLNEKRLAPSPVHQMKTRKHQFLVSSIVLMPETLPCNTSGKRTFFFQNLLTYTQKGSRLYQLPPNSCSLVTDPKCYAFSWDP